MTSILRNYHNGTLSESHLCMRNSQRVKLIHKTPQTFVHTRSLEIVQKMTRATPVVWQSPCTCTRWQLDNTLTKITLFKSERPGSFPTRCEIGERNEKILTGLDLGVRGWRSTERKSYFTMSLKSSSSLVTEINMVEYGSCCQQREVLVDKSHRNGREHSLKKWIDCLQIPPYLQYFFHERTTKHYRKHYFVRFYFTLYYLMLTVLQKQQSKSTNEILIEPRLQVSTLAHYSVKLAPRRLWNYSMFAIVCVVTKMILINTKRFKTYQYSPLKPISHFNTLELRSDLFIDDLNFTLFV